MGGKYYEITALDIKALKTCDRIKFWYSGATSDWGPEVLSHLEAIKDGTTDADDPWSTQGPLTRRIDTNFQTYAHGHWRYEGDTVFLKCYWTEPAHYVWMKTWINLLKPGDYIRLDWDASDANFGNMSWTTDRLMLNIVRDGLEKFAVNIHTDTTAKDGWGRMCHVRYPSLRVGENVG